MIVLYDKNDAMIEQAVKICNVQKLVVKGLALSTG